MCGCVCSASATSQRVQLLIYQILRPGSAHIEGTLRPKYIIQGHMDPLGFVFLTAATPIDPSA